MISIWILVLMFTFRGTAFMGEEHHTCCQFYPEIYFPMTCRHYPWPITCLNFVYKNLDNLLS